MKKFYCQMKGCGKESRYLGEAVEETAVPNEDPPDYKNKLLGVQRSILIECPEHGRRFWRHIGHHISTPGPLKGIKVNRQPKK